MMRIIYGRCYILVPKTNYRVTTVRGKNLDNENFPDQGISFSVREI